MTFTQDQVWAVVKKIAPKYALDPYLVMAICQQESAKVKGQPTLYDPAIARLEQGVYARTTSAMDYASTTEVLLAASWGVMQMMGVSLLGQGFFERRFALLSPSEKVWLAEPMSQYHVVKALNEYDVVLDQMLEEGCQFFKEQKLDKVGGDVAKALLRWNGGGNQQYDDEVLARIPKLKAILKLN